MNDALSQEIQEPIPNFLRLLSSTERQEIIESIPNLLRLLSSIEKVEGYDHSHHSLRVRAVLAQAIVERLERDAKAYGGRPFGRT